MLYSQTLERLRSLRLEGMIAALEEQRAQPDIGRLDFEERLALLVERQWLWRENRALATRLHAAQLKLSEATLEAIDYRASRGLKRAQVDQLRAGDWVARARNTLITGPTGVGKTFLACALGHQACREGHRTLYFYAPKFFRALQLARADGTLLKLLKKLARARLLILDDLGVCGAGPQAYRDLLEVLDDRHGQGATIVTSQFPPEKWHQLVGDETLADAILDRLVHNAYRLQLQGDSMRKRRANAKEP